MNYHKALFSTALSFLFVYTPVYGMEDKTKTLTFFDSFASSATHFKKQAVSFLYGKENINDIKDNFYITSEKIYISLYELSKLQQDIDKQEKINHNQYKKNQLEESSNKEIQKLKEYINTLEQHILEYDTSIINSNNCKRIQNLKTIQNLITNTPLKEINIEELMPQIHEITNKTTPRIDKIDKNELLGASNIELFIPSTRSDNSNDTNINETNLLNVSNITPITNTPTETIVNNPSQEEIKSPQEQNTLSAPEIITYINNQQWENPIKICCLQLLWIANQKDSDKRQQFTAALKEYQFAPPHIIHKKWNIPIQIQFIITTENIKTFFNNTQCTDKIFTSVKKLINEQIKTIEENINKTKKDIENEQKQRNSKNIENKSKAVQKLENEIVKQIINTNPISIETWHKYKEALKEYYESIKNENNVDDARKKTINKIKNVKNKIKQALLDKNKNKQHITINEWNKYLSALNDCSTLIENKKADYEKKVTDIKAIIRKKIEQELRSKLETLQAEINNKHNTRTNLILFKQLLDRRLEFAPEKNKKSIQENIDKIKERLEELNNKDKKSLIDINALLQQVEQKEIIVTIKQNTSSPITPKTFSTQAAVKENKEKKIKIDILSNIPLNTSATNTHQTTTPIQVNANAISHEPEISNTIISSEPTTSTQPNILEIIEENVTPMQNKITSQTLNNTDDPTGNKLKIEIIIDKAREEIELLDSMLNKVDNATVIQIQQKDDQPASTIPSSTSSSDIIPNQCNATNSNPTDIKHNNEVAATYESDTEYEVNPDNQTPNPITNSAKLEPKTTPEPETRSNINNQKTTPPNQQPSIEKIPTAPTTPQTNQASWTFFSNPLTWMIASPFKKAFSIIVNWFGSIFRF